MSSPALIPAVNIPVSKLPTHVVVEVEEVEEAEDASQLPFLTIHDRTRASCCTRCRETRGAEWATLLREEGDDATATAIALGFPGDRAQFCSVIHCCRDLTCTNVTYELPGSRGRAQYCVQQTV